MRLSITLAMCAALTAAHAQQPWTLEQCVARAEEKNLAVLNASLDAELADKTHDQTYWDLAPNLNGVATHGYNYGRVVDRFTNTFATDRVRTNNFYLSSTVSLFEGMRKQGVIKRSELDAKAALQGMEAARNQVRLEVVQAFLDVLGLRERLVAAEAQAASTREQIARTQAMVEAGRLARADLLSLESQLAQEEYTITDISNQRDQRMLALGRSLQLEPQEMMSFDIQGPVISSLSVMEPTSSADEVLANVLRTNPSFAQAETQVSSAERNISIAKAGSIPSLTLNGSVGTGFSGRDVRVVGEPVVGAPILIGATASGEEVYTPNVSYNTELTPFNDQLDQNLNESIGFTLNVPLFNNMQNKLAIDQARVQHEKTRNNMVSVRNDLQRNVLDAMVAQRSGYRQFLAAQKAVEAGTLNLEFAQERFVQGVITSMELSIVKAGLNRSTADMINAKYQYVMATKYLDILQGMPVTL
ncbi:MAG: TolC family protein [Flavobacteriales bacterium]|nr:TolC family protein [Flavobacteriales bacterium]MBP7409449.1 TolC family protein [Flavobacteriales bacterium]